MGESFDLRNHQRISVMSYLARSRVLGTSLRRSCLQTRSQVCPAQTRLAHSDYGSGDGHPQGEKPQNQGPNPSADNEEDVHREEAKVNRGPQPKNSERVAAVRE